MGHPGDRIGFRIYVLFHLGSEGYCKVELCRDFDTSDILEEASMSLLHR